MLTIKSPIQIRCKSPMETIHRDFSEKIIGNYTIMNSRLRKEELLYVTTQAPEVYFAEGNSISILNDVDITSNQEIKLDMINNLINRILVSGTNNFSYQDSVYISSVLRKIGITDVNNFMKNVHRLQEEKRENNKLINIYEEQKNLLMSVFEQAREEKKSREVTQEINNEYHSRYYIHEEIYNRLDTAKLYQQIQQFSQGIETDAKRIYNTEVNISEQVSLAHNFNLHNLKKEIFNSSEPINYYHANMYELTDNEELPVQTAHEKITSAILLNLVDDIYSLRINQIEQNNHNWYTLASALFQTADNTWKRYETYHNDNKQLRSDMYNTLVAVVENKKQENNIISNIIREMKNINQTNEFIEYETTNSAMQNINNSDNKNYDVHGYNYENINRSDIINRSEYNRYENVNKVNENYSSETVNLNYREEFNSEINKVSDREYTPEITGQEYDEINYRNINDIMNRSEYNRYEDNIRNTENQYNETVNLNYLEEFNEMVNENDGTEHVTEITRQQLDEINRRNIENYKKIQAIEINRPHITNVEINKEKARADMLRAINNPQEVIMEYLQSQTDNSFEETNNRLDTEIVNLFTDETREIFNQYMQQKNGQLPIVNNINTNIRNEFGESEYNESHVNMEHRAYIENFEAPDESDEVTSHTQSQNINNVINDYHPDINEYFTESERKLYEQFFEQAGNSSRESAVPVIEENNHIHNDGDNIMIHNNPVTMEVMDTAELGQKNLQPQINEIHTKTSVRYEINEIIQKNIEQLRNYNENYLYNNFINGEEENGQKQTVNLVYGQNEISEPGSPELQHIIMQSRNSEYLIQNTLNERTITNSKIGLVHKVEEQVITEELLNTIKERTVDNRKEETIEHSTHNIVKNEKSFQETVNSIQLNKQNNIEEIVQQNVQKQINRISDQVYGKIEKKLQSERKRRGY